MHSKTSRRVGSESATSAISVSVRITRNRVVAPRFNQPVNEEAKVKAIPNARICIAEIGRLLDGHTWLAGDMISLADLLLAPHLSMFALAPEGGSTRSWAGGSRGLKLARA
jgi:glutathione S-transferase